MTTPAPTLRLWLLPQGEDGRDSVILTGEQLQAGDVHPLRCLYLGRWPATDDPAALAHARANLTRPELVISRNIRTACDRRQTKRWRLSDQEIDLLISGHLLHLRDRLGQFTVAYSRIEPTP